MSYSFSDLERDLDVSRETLDKIKVYGDLLVKWQKAKNLVSNSTLDDIWRRHFLDSAQMAPLLKERFGEKQIKMLDIGSGAGFPALVLASMGIGEAHMVESVGRKCIFMRQVSRETSANAQIHNVRIEELEPFEVDIVTSRACARVLQLMNWAKPFLKENVEMWLLKGETAEEELTEAQAYWKMDINRFDSLSDPSGVILRLSNIKQL
ncbi:16S rRNA (guanine(527)-N(7))-methyltransferase RsmG [Kordiimonas sp. SCSIO 12603]|uniref:16S rRNA (guanine(527)-N(7))-methyltransferase RsmG n=1 Tax=Kordiimonas sp. SCSIO 12603 TaxID=2829596 RepID=UPI0021024A7E|nr:16S rRNA (guanine(527)-N(7))-methyltransferase RsmG [Kordiimonas sp. SCSIO 12603]UTW59108.1 16S rRNA (guanine(527)-N(7))-methyltransferase RsmG [Kordiimonas sp. SCSIO 12603]